MLATVHSAVVSVLAATEGGGVEASGGNFLVTPELGLMIWTLLAFGITFLVLRKLAFPRIAEALDKRQRAIEESIDTAARTKVEAEELLAEYRERLKEARAQADEIVSRARKAGETVEAESLADAKAKREELLQQTRRDIEAETRRAIQEIRNEVADLTIMATEKVTRKTLDEADQKRLVEEALGELDFSQLSGEGSRN
jgi:F-type H+-transporting ATPase subunit b